jgi:2-amino-4-hydroxy-6-hydroxymethyldihydropteridine diphosphokinase
VSLPAGCAALALGGNIGEPARAFAQALAQMEAGGAARVLARSRVWRTPPWGKTDQPDFLNMAALVETRLSPRALLDLCLDLERRAGRLRAQRWGPRTLDLDVIAFADLRCGDDRLTLPHPRAHERAFVLAPLAEIAPALTLGGRRADALAAAADMTGMSVDEAATRIVRGF